MTESQKNCDSLINLSVLDPARYGWTVIGGITEICQSHDRARRRSTQLYFVDKHRKSENDLAVDNSLHVEANDSLTTTSTELNESKDKTKDTSEDKRGTELGQHSAEVHDEDVTLALKGNASTSLPQPSAKNDNSWNQIIWDLGPQYEVSLRSIPRKKKRIHRCKLTVNRVRAINDKGLVDVNAYHRGIAGEEPRYKKSGILCCDAPQSDTNHGWEPLLDMKCKIMIQFPLAEPEIINEEQTANCGMKGTTNGPIHQPSIRTSNRPFKRKANASYSVTDVPIFVDHIDWNLFDPRAPTPMVYASEIGAEFGLSLCATLDLSRSIQEQIDAFVRDNIKYNVPIISDEPLNPKYTGKLVPPIYSKATLLSGGHCASDVRECRDEASIKSSNPIVSIPITHHLPTTASSFLISEKESTLAKSTKQKSKKVSEPKKYTINKKQGPSSARPLKTEVSCTPIITKNHGSLPTRLAVDTDKDYVNPLHCYVRSELLELIQVEEGSSELFPGQVGLRCVFCARVAPNLCSKTAQIFPRNLENLYRKVCIWQREHFTGDKKHTPCAYLPEEVRHLYKMKKEESNARGHVAYWKQSASSIGLRNSNTHGRNGIIFIDDDRL